MNRREAIRSGALALTGVAAGAVNLVPSDVALAQSLPAAPTPLARDEAAVRFGALPDEVLAPVRISVPGQPVIAKSAGTSKRAIGFPGLEGNQQAVLTVDSATAPSENQFTFLTDENGKSLPPADFAKQFIPFQASLVNNAPRIVEFSSVQPTLETPADRPDVVIDAGLEAFHVAASEQINRETRASLRLTFGSDRSTDRGRVYEDTLYWAITTGLNLWNEEKNRKSTPKELKSDFGKALGSNYIELPGAIGDLKLEVIKHTEPPWWRRAFNFLRSDTGTALTSVLGFPAVTKQVVDFIDQVASRLETSRPEILVQSRWVKAAFSKQARDDYTAGGFANIGVLQPGHWVLARGQDLAKLNNQSVGFHGGYGLLVPTSVKIEDIVTGKVPDPFADVTYAVLRVRIKPRMINVGF